MPTEIPKIMYKSACKILYCVFAVLNRNLNFAKSEFLCKLKILEFWQKIDAFKTQRIWFLLYVYTSIVAFADRKNVSANFKFVMGKERQLYLYSSITLSTLKICSLTGWHLNNALSTNSFGKASCEFAAF